LNKNIKQTGDKLVLIFTMELSPAAYAGRYAEYRSVSFEKGYK
jgi:hypothetical protein